MTERNKKNIWIVGIGNSGLKVLDRLQQMKEAAWLNLLAVDTDKHSLDCCQVENKISAGFEWTDGLGCGGDPAKGERSLSLCRSEISDFIRDADLLVITGGLGGGTGTGGAPIAVSVAKNLKVSSVALMSMPFVFEGANRKKTAENGLKELVLAADAVMPLPNDLLFSSRSGNERFDVSFSEVDNEIARAILGVCEMIRCANYISVDVADFKRLLNKKKSVCSIGIGVASSESDGENRFHVAIERLLNSPLLGGNRRIGKSDAVMISAVGGSDFQIGEMKKSLENIAAMARTDAEVVIGANSDSAYENRLQLTVVLVEYDKLQVAETSNEPLHFENKKVQKAQLEEAVQAELPLQNVSRGIFSKTQPFYFRQEDLDIPTFQRRQISLDHKL